MRAVLDTVLPIFRASPTSLVLVQDQCSPPICPNICDSLRVGKRDGYRDIESVRAAGECTKYPH